VVAGSAIAQRPWSYVPGAQAVQRLEVNFEKGDDRGKPVAFSITVQTRQAVINPAVDAINPLF